MNTLNLNSLTLPELKQLQKDTKEPVAGFEDRKKSEARAALEVQAKELGHTLAELVGLPVARVHAAAAPKYRHPENAVVTWSGRARKPHRFIDALAAGETEESLAV